MLLIIADIHEPNVESLCRLLDLVGTGWFRLNDEDLTVRSHLLIEPCRHSGMLTGSGDRQVPLADITSVWYRRRGQFPMVDGLDPGQREFINQEFEYAVRSLYFILGGCYWVNDFFMEARAAAKGFQLWQASSLGLTCPESLICDQPEQARSFWQKHKGQVLVKPLGPGGLVRGHDEKASRFIYANRLTAEMLDSLDAVTHSPVLLQEYIPKELELRVTIVGKAVFATAIESQKSARTEVDWRRYDLENTPHYPYTLPIDLQNRLLAFMERMGLVFGTIDLIKDARDGRYVFLEVNSAGQWQWVERFSGHPITESLATLLSRKEQA